MVQKLVGHMQMYLELHLIMETDQDTVYIKYTAGAITMGAQITQIDKSAANSDVDRNHLQYLLQ